MPGQTKITQKFVFQIHTTSVIAKKITSTRKELKTETTKNDKGLFILPNVKCRLKKKNLGELELR